MDHLHQLKTVITVITVTCFQQTRVGEAIGGDTVPLHLEEGFEGDFGVRVVLGLGPDEGVVEVGVGAGDEVEGVDGGGEVAGEGECGDELGGDVRVLVEVVLEDLGVDLLHGVEVGAAVEVRELLLQEPPRREPCRRTRRRSRHLHLLLFVSVSFMKSSALSHSRP